MEKFIRDNSSNNGKLLTLQKKIIGIMAAAQPRTSCKSLFKNQRFYLFHVNINFP